MTAVYDASVVVRWFVADALSAVALNSRETFGPAFAPSLLMVEAANAFRRYVVAGKLSRQAADDNLRTVESMVATSDHKPLLEEAFDLACAHNHSMSDCLYVALARRRELPLVTADGKLARKFAALPGLDLHPLAG